MNKSKAVSKVRKSKEHFNTSEPHSRQIASTKDWWSDRPNKTHSRLYQRRNGTFFLLELQHTCNPKIVRGGRKGWTRNNVLTTHDHRRFSVSATDAACWYITNVVPTELRPLILVDIEAT